MLRFLMVLAVAGTIMAGAFASAAGLGVTGGTIQAGVDSSLYCDVDGVQVAGWGLETATPYGVNSVRLADIDGACVGNDMFVGVYDGAGATLIGDPKMVAIAGSTASVSFPLIDPAKIEKIMVWIEGPAGVTP